MAWRCSRQKGVTSPEVALRDVEIRGGLATGHLDLSGQLRDTGETWLGHADLVMTVDVDARVTEIAIQMDEARVARLLRARQA